MPPKKNQSDSEFDLGTCSDVEESSQHYNTINYQTRLKLIELVIQQKNSIIKASKELNIKLSTAKFIVNCYKKKGKIMKRKSQLRKQKPVQNLVQTQDQKQDQIMNLKVKLQEEDQSEKDHSELVSNIPVPLFMSPQMFYLLNYQTLMSWGNFQRASQY